MSCKSSLAAVLVAAGAVGASAVVQAAGSTVVGVAPAY